MVNAHIFMDGNIIRKTRMEHVPRVGETLRVLEGIYSKVTEVVWCLDEKNELGQRVNIRTEQL